MVGDGLCPSPTIPIFLPLHTHHVKMDLPCLANSLGRLIAMLDQLAKKRSAPLPVTHSSHLLETETNHN